MQRLPAITHDRFGLFRFRSPLLTESRLFSLPVGTEMFHFPTFPLPALYIQAGVTRSSYEAERGFPIRRPSDRSPLIGSPRIIADCYVLLRLQMPRHPPFALRNLTTYMSMNRVLPTRRQKEDMTNDLLALNKQSNQNIHESTLEPAPKDDSSRDSKMLASTV